MWYKGKFTPGQPIIRSPSWIHPKNIDSHELLMLELCKKYEGKVELVIKSADEREFFSNIHFPFCYLGTRKGSVESYQTFIQFLKENKVIDLIYNCDAFISNEEDRLAAKAHSQRSSTSGAAESFLSSQVFPPQFQLQHTKIYLNPPKKYPFNPTKLP
jgi:hypothetical protein